MFHPRVRPLPHALTLLLCLINTPSHAVDVTQLLQSADRSRGNLQGLVWSVKTITTEEGEQDQTLEFRLFTKNSNSLVKFTSPARMNGQMMLMRDRNMWFIRPGLRKPVSISPRQRLTGAASNGDIASTNYAEDYEAILVGEEIKNDTPCYVLDLSARSKDVTYDKIRYWVSKSGHLGKHAGFYTVSGKLFKEAAFFYDNEILKDGRRTPFVSKMIITDSNSNTRTTLHYSDVVIRDVPDSTFNLNLLVR